MERSVILKLLAEIKPSLAANYGIEQIGIFGSVAKDEAKVDSDIDIVVVMPPDLYQMVHAKDDLEEALQSTIDLIRYSKYMYDPLRQRIDREAVYV